jgi:hypothetical protein
MSATAPRTTRDGRVGGGPPLVAVVCKVPLLCEALVAALDSIAEVRRFPAGRGDLGGLLRWLRPDAIVVDTEEEAGEAEAFARESGSPLVHVSLADRKIRVLGEGGWEEPHHGDASPEAIRNAIVGSLLARSPA